MDSDLDTQILSLTDQEVRALAMILAAMHEADARETLGFVLAVTRKEA